MPKVIEDRCIVLDAEANIGVLIPDDKIIAGTDCGFAAFAGQTNPVVSSIVWAKLAALTEGARIASDRLWG